MTTPQVAYMFPGQGSQASGMLNAWRDHRLVTDAVAEASNAIDLDLWALIESGPVASLNDTVNTQPVMVAASIALYRVWQQALGGQPLLSAGHSVGEISALTAAGAFDLSQAVTLVRARARAMAQAMPPGVAGMAAVLGLDDASVEELCQTCAQGEVLEPVNYNAPGQVVVAGHLAAIERIKVAAKLAGAKMVFVLPVSGPFHSSLMAGAAGAFSTALDTVPAKSPAFPVIHNSDQSIASLDSIKPCLVAQLTRPVNWIRTVRQFQAAGVTHVVEIGPGEVLSNLIKRIAPELVVLGIHSPQALDKALVALSLAT